MRNVILSLDAGDGYGSDTTGSHFLKLLNVARMVTGCPWRLSPARCHPWRKGAVECLVLSQALE